MNFNHIQQGRYQINNENVNTYQNINGNCDGDASDSINDHLVTDNYDMNDDDDDDDNNVKQDYDLDRLFLREQREEREEQIDTISSEEDDDDDNNMENIDTQNQIVMNRSTTIRTLSNSIFQLPSVEGKEENILSQKLNQLSTSGMVNSKKNQKSSNSNNKMMSETPDYLAKNNKFLENILSSLVFTTTTITSTNKFEDFRQMAISIHHIKYNQILHSLWTIYLKSGLDELKTSCSIKQPSLTAQLWPISVRSIVKNNIHSSVNEHNACLTYVKERLAELEKHIQQYQSNLSHQTNRLSTVVNNLLIIRQNIETFIEEKLTYLRRRIEHKIQLVNYDYDEYILELQYLQHHPTEIQIQLANQCCLARQQHEITKYELQLLEKRIHQHKNSVSSTSFHNLSISNVPLFDSIDNLEVQQQFYIEYRQVIEQAKIDMLNQYLSSARKQMQQYQDQYKDDIEKFWENQRSLSDHEKLNPTMIDLIEKRANVIAIFTFSIIMNNNINPNHMTTIYSSGEGGSDPPQASLHSPLFPLNHLQSTIVQRSSTAVNHNIQTKTRKKCHGNKKLQRFRKRRRARGMSEAAINKTIAARKPENKKQQEAKNKQNTTTASIPYTTTTTTTNDVVLKQRKLDNQNKSVILMSTKLKRDDVTSQDNHPNMVPSSFNQLQIPSSTVKKMKKSIPFIQIIQSTSTISINTNYPPSTYLTKLPYLIFDALSQQLNCVLNKKDQQIFIHLRLHLFDRQFRLDVDRHLWQSYLDLASHEQIWPQYIYQIAETNQSHVCQQYVLTQLTDIKQQVDQCNSELSKQASSSSIPLLLPSLNILDSCLKEYVYLQQNYLFKRINQQLIRCKNDISDQKLYQQLLAYHLTIDQQQTIQQLINLRQIQLQVYEDMIMLKERILHRFLPPNFDQIEEYIAPNDYYSPPITDHSLVEIKTKRRKILQHVKRTLINIYMCAYETKIDEYEQEYQQILNEIELKYSNNTSIVIINGLTLFDAIKAYMLHRTNFIQQEIYYKIAYFRQIIAQRRQRSSTAKKTIGVSPQVTIDVLHHIFNDDELTYLSKGESYIRPNQSALRPYKHRNSQIQTECKQIKDAVECQLTRYCHRSPPKTMLDRYGELLQQRLHRRFMAPLSFVDFKHAQQEKDIVKSIRRKLRKQKQILRVCDKGGGLHISEKSEYERKAAEYRRDTNAYEELSYNPLEEMFKNVTSVLNELKDKKQLSFYRYNQIVPKINDIKLSYMYFNPKAHKEGSPLRPIINTIKSVTRQISEFLDQLIRPIYNEHSKENTIIDGVNLIQRLEKYTSDGHLKTSTYFCTFDITNLYTMIPQDESIKILGLFLRHYVGEYVKGVSVTTIEKLSEIVLKQNAFVCDNKFYRQVIGGAMGSPFTLTLANIFMWHWEQCWIRRQNHLQEIYGRYIDDVFFTSNEPTETIQQLLKDANGWHSNIKLQANIGKSVTFLDVLVNNDQGVLHTSVYHKPSAEPYVVPFDSDHPRYTFANVVQTALVRAIRYSSTFKAFNIERRTIELLLLYNGYPITYIDKQFRKVFLDAISDTSLLPKIDDEYKFFQLRRQLMGQPTPRQSQIDAQIAQSKQHHENYIEQQVKSSIATSTSTTTPPHGQKFQDNIIIHYTHENRFTSMKRDMHEIFREAFKGLGIETVRLIVGHRTSPNTQRELIRKRPHISLLK
ncbi:unnamed protein product, partial [Rotaria sordida]